MSFIRGAPDLSHLPVVMFTSSEADGDIAASYRELANAYIVKPQHPSKFSEAVAQVARFWTVHNKLPRFGSDVYQRPALWGGSAT